jgi:hypothetical protein
LTNGGWEYAPMFNMKFHADERSMDMTRRRRWHRKMVPSAEDNLRSTEHGTVFANTDIIFRMQSSVPAIAEPTATKTDQETTPTDVPLAVTPSKEIKIELNAPRMFLCFKSESITCESTQFK